MQKKFAWLYIAVLCALIAGLYMPQLVFGAATTNETGNLRQGLDGFYAYPISVNWPLSTDVTELISLPGDSTSGCYFGHPVAYIHLGFQDQSGGSGGEGLAAQEVEHTFISPTDYGSTGISAHQITIHRQEFDGTISTQDSVVSTGVFLFTPQTGLFD
jgi:hypothetical protein